MGEWKGSYSRCFYCSRRSQVSELETQVATKRGTCILRACSTTQGLKIRNKGLGAGDECTDFTAPLRLRYKSEKKQSVCISKFGACNVRLRNLINPFRRAAQKSKPQSGLGSNIWQTRQCETCGPQGDQNWRNRSSESLRFQLRIS